ncbi:hypothetical protein SMALB_3887 [Streptomyces malaysiensis]|uniref:Uncharacterized protein n=1 Tax=Streptomyces malaysiensis TaxID=92644 RepID=A0A7X5X3D4_STRMQ|nr:hypothetical protein [Streptomyces malaysiensis]
MPDGGRRWRLRSRAEKAVAGLPDPGTCRTRPWGTPFSKLFDKLVASDQAFFEGVPREATTGPGGPHSGSTPTPGHGSRHGTDPHGPGGRRRGPGPHPRTHAQSHLASVIRTHTLSPGPRLAQDPGPPEPRRSPIPQQPTSASTQPANASTRSGPRSADGLPPHI